MDAAKKEAINSEVSNMETIQATFVEIQKRHQAFIEKHAEFRNRQSKEGWDNIQFKEIESSDFDEILKNTEEYFNKVDLQYELMMNAIKEKEELIKELDDYKSNLNHIIFSMKNTEAGMNKKRYEIGVRMCSIYQQKYDKEMTETNNKHTNLENKITEEKDNLLNEYLKEYERKCKEANLDFDNKMKNSADQKKKEVERIKTELKQNRQKVKDKMAVEWYYNLKFEEYEQIEQWTGKKCDKIIFDSDQDNWSEGTSVFDEKVRNQSNLIFIVEDTENNKFGGYISSTVHSSVDYSTGDSNAFLFRLSSSRTTKERKKFTISSSYTGSAFVCSNQSSSNLFYFGNNEIYVNKQNRKNSSFCKQHSTIYYSYSTSNELLPYTSNENNYFTPKRIMVIQMK